MGRTDKRARPTARAVQPEGRVITIGWQVVALPVLLVAVVGLGYFVGRQAAARRTGTPSAAAPAAPVAPATLAAGAVVQVPVGTGQAVDIPAQAFYDPTSRYDPNVVYDLPERPHALLGQPAPDFTMTDIATGQAVKLSDYRGQPVLLDFWATWCTPCRFEMPWLQAVYEKYQADGLVVLGFDVGEKVSDDVALPRIQAFVDQYGLTFPILYGDADLSIQVAWSVAGYPSAFFIDADGTVVDFHQSMFPNQITLESRLASIIPGAGPTAAASE